MRIISNTKLIGQSISKRESQKQIWTHSELVCLTCGQLFSFSRHCCCCCCSCTHSCPRSFSFSCSFQFHFQFLVPSSSWRCELDKRGKAFCPFCCWHFRMQCEQIKGCRPTSTAPGSNNNNNRSSTLNCWWWWSTVRGWGHVHVTACVLVCVWVRVQRFSPFV